MPTTTTTERENDKAQTMPKIGDLCIHDGYLGEVIRTFPEMVDLDGNVKKACYECYFQGMPYRHNFVQFAIN